MKIVKKSRFVCRKGDAVIAPVFTKAGLDHIVAHFPDAAEWLKKKKISGKIGENVAFTMLSTGNWIQVMGAGKPNSAGHARKLAKRIIQSLRENRFEQAIVYFPPSLNLDGEYLCSLVDYLHLNHYAFDRYLKKKKKPIKRLVLVPGGKRALSQSQISRSEKIAAEVAFYRDLVNEIPSKVNPDFLVETFRRTAAEKSLRIEVLRRRQLEEKKMNGLLAVGSGGCCEPALVTLIHEPDSYSLSVAVVGKGVTFDSGGLDIKPASGMEEMKSDMAGAALAAVVVRAAAALKIPVKVIGIAAIAENMPGSRAYKPGDIITFANGRTVEIVNTDAEGRLILADALIEASHQKPDMIVEFSTLTGAMVVALGDAFAGLMTKNRRLATQLVTSGERTGEFLWEMPLFDDYQESIRSKVADLKNAGYQGASSIKAGLFLAEFVGKIPFAHIDIAGTAFISRPNHYFAAEGATGFGLRLMLDFFESLRQQ